MADKTNSLKLSSVPHTLVCTHTIIILVIKILALKEKSRQGLLSPQGWLPSPVRCADPCVVRLTHPPGTPFIHDVLQSPPVICWNHGSVGITIYRLGQLEINTDCVSYVFIFVTRPTHGEREGLIVAFC